MELKEYFKIIKNDATTFLTVAAIVVLGAFAYFVFRPVAYETSLALNITRSGVQETSAYRYDDFYRLQADEKFADTLVEWLKNPRIASDIYDQAGIPTERLSLRRLGKIFAPEKRSAQLVTVSFAAENPDKARKISAALVRVVSKNIEVLNRDQKESGWFQIIAGEPVIVKRDFSAPLVLAFSLLAGIFLAFWIVLVRHYLK